MARSAQQVATITVSMRFSLLTAATFVCGRCVIPTQSDAAVDENRASAQVGGVRPSSSSSASAPAIDPSQPAVPTSSSLPSPSSSSPSVSPDDPVASLLYIPGATLPTLSRYHQRCIDVRIPSKHLSTKNSQLLTRQLWGDGLYTDDSDIVAVLAHSGRVILRANPPAEVGAGGGGLVATVRVLPALEKYEGRLRYGVRSRGWSAGWHRCSLQVVGCEWVEQVGLVRSKKGGAADAPGPASAAFAGAGGKAKDKREVKQLKMIVVERGERSAVSGGGVMLGRRGATKRKWIPEVSLGFSRSNDPWLRWSLFAVSDRGVDEAAWVSARLRQESLLTEGDDGRWELRRTKKPEKKATASSLSHVSPSHTPTTPFVELVHSKPPTSRKAADFDTYTWSRTQGDGGEDEVAVGGGGRGAANGRAAKGDALDNLDWSELEWAEDGVTVRGKPYRITLCKWRPLST